MTEPHLLALLKRLVADVEAGRTELITMDCETHYSPVWDGLRSIGHDYEGETWRIRMRRIA